MRQTLFQGPAEEGTKAPGPFQRLTEGVLQVSSLPFGFRDLSHRLRIQVGRPARAESFPSDHLVVDEIVERPIEGSTLRFVAEQPADVVAVEALRQAGEDASDLGGELPRRP